MNEIEELRYLGDLLLASTRWVRETEESPTGLELEIQDRIQRLTSVPKDRLIGPGDPDGTRPKKMDRKHSEYAEKNVRVRLPNGKVKWVSRDKVMKQEMPGGRFKWVLREVDDVAGKN